MTTPTVQPMYYYDPNTNTYVPVQQPSTAQSWFNYSDPSYLKGLAVGAGVALVLSSPAVRNSIVSGAVKLWTGVQGGIEEVKEQIQDIKAEASQE